jgi:hypothetical protein
VAHAAAGADPGTGMLILDVVLSTIWVAVLQAVIFGLLPIRFLPAERVVRWSRLGWVAIYGLALVLFVQAVARPGGAPVDGGGTRALWPLVVLLSVGSVMATVFWAWFRFGPRARTRVDSGPRS